MCAWGLGQVVLESLKQLPHLRRGEIEVFKLRFACEAYNTFYVQTN